MDWKRHLNANRFGDPRPPWVDSNRSAYEQDQDRITYSTAFRRLAGKTQVFPLPESDVTHHRMTHTLEVVSAGRSLGRLVGAGAVGRNGSSLAGDVAAAVAAACLAHDIGNPPFGHSGEDAIAAFFANGPGRDILRRLDDEALAKDFQEYEGNALGFRLLTRTKAQQSSAPGGMRLTYATLGAFLKYPRTASSQRTGAIQAATGGVASRASEKKFGAFQDDAHSLTNVAETLGLSASQQGQSWRRHPLAFLVEAADDICNRVIDLEDSYRVGLIRFEEVEGLLMELLETGSRKPQRYGDFIDEKEKVAYLRALAIGSLIDEAGSVFNSNAEDIVSGEFDQPLIELAAGQTVLERIDDLMKARVYCSDRVLKVELAGYQVIGGLLDLLIEAFVWHPNTKRSAKVRELVPAHYTGPQHAPLRSEYGNLMNLTEFVASMTDTYAINLYRTLTGVQLPGD